MTNVIERERITTTLRRAKATRPLVERLITLGSGYTSRPPAGSRILDDARSQEIFRDIARFADRPGGYTRIIHAGFRIGDGADLAILELIGSKLKKRLKKERGSEKPEAKAEKEEAAEAKS